MSGAREQVTRLLALVPYLQQRREGVPLRQVADDFGVTVDQVRKDLNVLWMCGLPGLGPGELMDIDFEAFENDPDGLVRIENADYLSRPLRLGSTEASALIVALRALREGSPDAPREVVDRVLVKLEDATAGTPAPLAAQPDRRRTALTETRAVLQAAVDDDRQLRLAYYVPARDETTDRTVDPLALLSRDGHEYLDAWCHAAQARRLFRLDRIDRVDVLSEPRVRPDEPPRVLGDDLFEGSPDDVVATLHLRPRARWVADYYPVESVIEAHDGGLQVSLRVGDPRWLVRLVLGLAPDAVVLSPPEYAEEVAARARAALHLYATPTDLSDDVTA